MQPNGSSSRLHLAWFSALGAQDWGATKSAYLTRVLLPLLSKKCDIELFSEQETVVGEIKATHFLKAARRDTEQRFDHFFYNLEDCRESNFARMHAGLRPGFSYFHDYIFANHGPEPNLNSPWRDVVEKFISPAIAWPARDKKHSPAGPYAYREGGLALAAAFPSARLHGDFTRTVKERLGADSLQACAHSYTIPYPVPEPCFAAWKPVAEPSIAFFGAPRIENRIYKILYALSKLQDTVNFVWMLPAAEKHAAENLCREFQLTRVRFVESADPFVWADVARQASLVLHTLVSGYGTVFPFLNISLALGVPIIASAFGDIDELPRDLCLKVSAGASEGEDIRYACRELLNASVPPLAKHIEYAREFYSAEVVAAELFYVLEKELPRVNTLSGRWQELEAEARRDIAAFVQQTWLQDDAVLPGREVVSAEFAETMKDCGWTA